MIQEKEIKELRVAGNSNASSVALAAVRFLSEGFDVFLLAIGVVAVNNAVRATVTARGIAATEGKAICFTSGYTKILLDNSERSVLRIQLHYTFGK